MAGLIVGGDCESAAPWNLQGRAAISSFFGAYAGTSALVLETQRLGPPPNTNSIAEPQPIPLVEGRTYGPLEFRLKLDTGSNFALSLFLDKGDGNLDEINSFLPASYGPTYTLVSVDAFMALGSHGRIRFVTAAPGVGGIALTRWLVDEILLEELEMPSSQVLICNLALAHIGENKRIESLDEESTEAAACGLVYDLALDAALSELDWSFARNRALLTVQAGTPPTPWGAQYLLPSDCVTPRSIADNQIVRRADQRIPYAIETVSGVRLLYTTTTEATLIYTRRETNAALYPSWFVLYLSWVLAEHLCAPLSAAESLAVTMRQRAQGELERAARIDFRSEQEAPEPDAIWIGNR